MSKIPRTNLTYYIGLLLTVLSVMVGTANATIIILDESGSGMPTMINSALPVLDNGKETTIKSMTSSATSTTTITVDDSGGADYMKIQQAVDNAAVGDTIEVRSGAYDESVVVDKQLVIKGVDTGGGRPTIYRHENSVLIPNSDGTVGISGAVTDGVTLTADGIIIEGFEITKSTPGRTGVMIYSKNNIIRNNVITNYIYGIFMDNSSGNILEGNAASSHYFEGMLIRYSSGNDVSNNVMNSNGNSYNGQGILLYYSNSNYMKSNTMRFNSYTGSAIIRSSSNTIINNRMENSPTGIRMSNNNNIIYDNYFNNTGNNAVILGITGITSGNNWNIVKTAESNIIGGSYIGGNYWGKLDGTGFSQTCANRGDGFCDQNYVLDSTNVDYLPLASNTSVNCGNTPEGQNITVDPASGTNVEFGNVTQCGFTTVITYTGNQWEPIPSGYNPIKFYDITTTAGHDNSITIQISYLDSDIPPGMDENTLKLLHYENGNWIDVTTSLDITSNTITGEVSSLSPFSIVGISSGSPTPTVSPTISPTSGNIVRGSSFGIIGIAILSACLIILSLLRLRMKKK